MDQAPRFHRGERLAAHKLNRLSDTADRAILQHDEMSLGEDSPSGSYSEPSIPFVESFPWDRIPFGFKRSGDDITIVNGELHWSDHGEYTVADTPITISSTLQWIGVEFDFNTLSFPAASSSKSTFLPDSTTFRTWLYRFAPTERFPVLINPVGIISLPAVWG